MKFSILCVTNSLILGTILLLLATRSASFHAKMSSCKLYTRRTSHKAIQLLAMRTELVGAVLNVKDPVRSLSFYRTNLGLPVDGQSKEVELTGRVSLQFHQNMETLKSEKDMFGIAVTYDSSTSVESIMQSLPRKRILQPFGNYKYGASMIPDEDYMLQTPVKYGKVLDEDGFPIEIHQKEKNSGNNRTCKLTIRVLDLNESIEFYTKRLNLSLLRKRSNVNNDPPDASMCSYLGNESENEGDMLQLLYIYGTDDKLKRGNIFKKLIFECDDINGLLRQFEGTSNLLNYDSVDKVLNLVDLNGHHITVMGKK